jgi:hypothetical protein
MFKFLLSHLMKRLLSERGANETTTTTMTEAIPTIKEVAMLELDDGAIIAPLVRNVAFPGPGVVHDTPFITRLTSETDDSLSNQALDTGGNDETSPSQATVGVHGVTVQLKEIAMIATPGDLAAMAGQLIGQAIAKKKDQDLATLFASFTPNLGDANEDITVGDLYGAYKSLRQGIAPLPYNLVITPGQFWGTKGLITLLETTTGKIQSQALGSVQEDIARNGFSGRILGFDVYTDNNITTTSNNASGAAFSRQAIKLVNKRGLRIDVDTLPDSGREVSIQVTGSEMWGEAILRNKHGVEMQFNEDT